MTPGNRNLLDQIETLTTRAKKAEHKNLRATIAAQVLSAATNALIINAKPGLWLGRDFYLDNADMAKQAVMAADALLVELEKTQ